jgi:antitoxin component of MazEF toxin-antitoxin module
MAIAISQVRGFIVFVLIFFVFRIKLRMEEQWMGSQFGEKYAAYTHQTAALVLELLNIDPETPLDVSTDGKQLIIAPAKPSARREKFEAAQQWAHKRYAKAFKKLAE